MTATIVLDATSLATLSRTGNYTYLSDFDAEFITTESVRDLLTKFAEDDEGLETVSNDLVDDDGVVQTVESPETHTHTATGLAKTELDAVSLACTHQYGYCSDDTDTLRSELDVGGLKAEIVSTPVLLAHLTEEEDESVPDPDDIEFIGSDDSSTPYVPPGDASNPSPPDDTTDVESVFSIVSQLESGQIADTGKDVDDVIEADDEDFEKVSDAFGEEEYVWTLVEKMVDCGKDRCTSCPHGPYLYLARRVSPDKLVWEYLGRKGTVDLSGYTLGNV